MFFRFFPNGAAEPTQQDYVDLVTATTDFYTSELALDYPKNNNNADATFLLVVPTITGSSFTDGVERPVQVNFDFEVYFTAASSAIPTSEAIFAVMQRDEASSQPFVNDLLWNHGDVWNGILGVAIEPKTKIVHNR